MKQPEKSLLDDFQHSVDNRIDAYGYKPDFPKMADYGVDRRALDDYLFEKQAVLDSTGTEKTRYVILGICVILPILVLDAIPEDARPWGDWTIVAAVGVGVLIAFFIYSLMKMVVGIRLRRMADAKMEAYIHAVLNYQPDNYAHD